MNEPIISPWIFYWIETMSQIKDIADTVTGVTMFMSIIFLIFTLSFEKEEREEHISEEMFGRITKGMIVAGIVSIIAYMFLPTKETMYKMLAASYIKTEKKTSWKLPC
ncbi:MAG: hypothetical protein EGP62_00105 [Dialister invisus]|nr:hypothetical protein [Dialister invisus]